MRNTNPATRHRPESPARFRLPTSVSALPKTKATGADRYTEEAPPVTHLPHPIRGGGGRMTPPSPPAGPGPGHHS